MARRRFRRRSRSRVRRRRRRRRFFRRRFPRPEQKYVYDEHGETANEIFPDETMGFEAFGGVGNGTGPQARIGNKIISKSIVVKGTVVPPSDGSNAWVRFGIVLDRHPDAGLPTAGDLYRVAATEIMAPHSSRNVDDTRRFKVIAVKRMFLRGTTDGDYMPKPFTIYKRWPKGLVVRYDNTTTGSVVANKYYLFYQSDQDAAGMDATKPQLRCWTQHRFTDA